MRFSIIGSQPCCFDGCVLTNIVTINVLLGDKRLCSQDTEKIRGEDSWTGELLSNYLIK